MAVANGRSVPDPFARSQRSRPNSLTIYSTPSSAVQCLPIDLRFTDRLLSKLVIDSWLSLIDLEM